jgi:hypothetical protein
VDGLRTHRRAKGQFKQTGPAGLPSLAERAGFGGGLNDLFSRAEGEIDLLRRSWPENAQQECQRLARAIERGEPARPAFRYARPPRLAALRRALDDAQQRLAGGSAVAELYAERAAELDLEAALAEHIGQPGFAALARLRYAPGSAPEWSAARALAREWTRPLEPAAPAACYASDDAVRPDSLVCVLWREIGRLQLPVRVRVVAELASVAATGDGVIYVRAGAQLSAAAAERIARHELHGHALPRVRARLQPLGLFRVGCARAAEDEEGRAVGIEQRTGGLDAERRRELGLRHRGALAVAEGADATETLRLARELGCPPDAAARLYARLARGGGLCRELAYLPAWLRVSSALSRDAWLEAWLGHGRISLAGARILKEFGVTLVEASAHSSEASTGA